MSDSRENRSDGRDTKGRFAPGVSGNPKGRPPEVADLDMSDVWNFANEPVEITIGGKKQVMTRSEVVLLKMFEAALKGRITALRYLFERFEQAEMSRQSIELWLEKMGECLDEDPESVPLDVLHMIQRALQVRTRPRSPFRKRPASQTNRNFDRD